MARCSENYALLLPQHKTNKKNTKKRKKQKNINKNKQKQNNNNNNNVMDIKITKLSNYQIIKLSNYQIIKLSNKQKKLQTKIFFTKI